MQRFVIVFFGLLVACSGNSGPAPGCPVKPGLYQFNFTTVSGNCGDVKSGLPVVIGKSEDLLNNIAAMATLTIGANPTCQEGPHSLNDCKDSLTVSCYADCLLDSGFTATDCYENNDVIVATLHDDGSVTGRVVEQTTTSGGASVCTGEYTFTAKAQ